MLLLFVFLTLGCGQSETPLWIQVGDPYDSVIEHFETIDAQSLQGMVGVRCSPDRCEFYVLPDGTCLEMTVRVAIGGEETISSITLGEAGKGYGDKRIWSRQQKTGFDRYDLSQDLLTNQESKESSPTPG